MKTKNAPFMQFADEGKTFVRIDDIIIFQKIPANKKAIIIMKNNAKQFLEYENMGHLLDDIQRFAQLNQEL